MNRSLVMTAALVLAGTAVLAGSSAGSAAFASTSGIGAPWAQAVEIPGTAALNTGGEAEISSVSCGAPGDCSADGFYTGKSRSSHAFVASQVGGTWGSAQEVAAALNTGDDSKAESVSCAAAGTCTAGGYYTDGSVHEQAFVLSQTGGTWGSAEEVPGTAALNTGGEARVSSVSCAAVGSCTAGGYYTDSSGNLQVFVASETGGAWGRAEEPPGIGTLNAGGYAYVSSVSCGAAGDCSVGGSYTDSSGHTQAFVLTQSGGAWGEAEEVPGTAALNTGGSAYVSSVSCSAVGDCTAAGGYADSSLDGHAFVVSQSGGRWGGAEQVPGITALSPGGVAALSSVSCGAAGDCIAGGDYADSAGHAQALVLSQTGGTWGRARELRGTAALNTGGHAEVTSVSCAAVGTCAVGGDYTDGSGHQQAFVASEVSGAWGKAEEVPGTPGLDRGGYAGVEALSCPRFGSLNCTAAGLAANAANRIQVVADSQITWSNAAEVPGTATLNTGGNAQLTSLSCAAAGDCTAGGYYTDSSGHAQAFVVSQTGGTWGNAEEVPGTATLNTGGNAQLTSVSCAAAGDCGAGGFYTDSSGHEQAFVATQAGNVWGQAEEVPGTATLNVGGNAQLTSVSCAAAGNCTAGGYYSYDNSGDIQAFVATQASGTWNKAKEAPGTGTFQIGYVLSVSCASAGNCSLGGTYYNFPDEQQAFVLSQTGGAWGQAETVADGGGPGIAAVLSVSCTGAGTCAAGGEYGPLEGDDPIGAFVDSQTGGTWGTAQEVPGTAALNTGGSAAVKSLSCATVINCTAGGYYENSSSHLQAFVDSQTGGTWAKAEEVPGTATLNTSGNAAVNSLSCSSGGNCAAGGEYDTNQASVDGQAFVDNQTGGTWGKAEEVPGTASLNGGHNAQVISVSCVPSGTCTAGGYYTDSSGHQQAFLTSQQ